MMTVSFFRMPRYSASSHHGHANAVLDAASGFLKFALQQNGGRTPLVTRFSRTRGVCPTVSTMLLLNASHRASLVCWVVLHADFVQRQTEGKFFFENPTQRPQISVRSFRHIGGQRSRLSVGCSKFPSKTIVPAQPFGQAGTNRDGSPPHSLSRADIRRAILAVAAGFRRYSPRQAESSASLAGPSNVSRR